ncbi:hypothetical protein Ari01nite_95340 [Paractinoplanes rishiriensis]|uniref:Uncharacterized protein n=1 Tax=Paractinoplanes rishiriensis TaxID=1050105 RepID=A0A919N041_9ACTN|nr:hypothetical protein Ari01nite_95340 [Actinoplanes rishiriensis]
MPAAASPAIGPQPFGPSCRTSRTVDLVATVPRGQWRARTALPSGPESPDGDEPAGTTLDSSGRRGARSAQGRRGLRMNEKQPRRGGNPAGGGNVVYGLGLIGALVYYLGAADGFWVGLLGVLKAIVWPAFLVYELLRSVAG